LPVNLALEYVIHYSMSQRYIIKAKLFRNTWQEKEYEAEAAEENRS